MGFIIKLLKLKITKVLIFLLTVAFIASLYFCRDWYITQYHKAIGFYYVSKGDKAYKKEKYQKAIDFYKIALKHYPGHSNASCNLGNIYVSFENYYEAVNAYENALKYSPNYMVCRMDLGIILAEKMADYDKAIQEYGKIVNSNPFTINIPFIFDNKKSTTANRGIAYYNMGLAYRGKAVYMGEDTLTSVKYLKKAKESYLKAEKYLKNNFDNTYNLAFTYHLLGDYNNAALKYCDAINIKPDVYEAHYNFALLLRSMNMNQEALEEFEKTTMLLDYYSNDDKTKYVFGIITEIKRRIINEGKYDYLKERIDITSLGKDEITYSKGKVVASKQKEFKMNELLKCNCRSKFENK
ncbi:MAG: tetratricopeptide repeat protein [Cyanobacteria bacterium SIG29]|nr:tetratricopeptide repeat protein [Cyanobacteria bacterium SIG29]